MNSQLMPRNNRTAMSSEQQLLETSTTPLLVSSDANDAEGERSSARYNNNSISTLFVTRLLAPLTDDSDDSAKSIAVGLSSLIIAGSVLGFLSASNIQTEWSHTLSACVGYTYFLMWSVSFYPQTISNWKRRTTTGLSADFCCLNVVGFACYAAYNLSMFYSASIHKQYKARHGEAAEVTVQSNDVAFAAHALLLACITLCQIGYYDGFHSQQKPSKFIIAAIAIMLLCITLYPVCLVVFGVGTSLDYLYLLSYVKMSVTLIKYMPQVLLNYQRKSTVGWSIWQILLDFSGGVLSDAQLVLDCWMMSDWSGITGNLAKFFLGFVSIFFDIIFMVQHYVLYPRHRPSAVLSRNDEQQPQENTGDKAVVADESSTV